VKKLRSWQLAAPTDSEPGEPLRHPKNVERSAQSANRSCPIEAILGVVSMSARLVVDKGRQLLLGIAARFRPATDGSEPPAPYCTGGIDVGLFFSDRNLFGCFVFHRSTRIASGNVSHVLGQETARIREEIVSSPENLCDWVT
jgi:hypothetical protein